MTKKIIPFSLFGVFILCSTIDLWAGMGAPGPPMGPPPCWPPPCIIPIDGGISFLIAAGLALGGKKIYDFRKKSV